MKRLRSMLLSSLVFGTLVFGVVGGLAPRYSVSGHAAPAEALDTDPGSYYDGITTTKSGNALLAEIHDLTVGKHAIYNSYANVGNAGMPTYRYDEALEDDAKVVDVYTHALMPISSGWNREHVWPKALSNNLWKTSNGGADAHHIRPDFVDVNSARGSKKFGDAVTTTASVYQGKQYGFVDGTNDSGTFEPMDFAKGDIARIIFYMFIHYNHPEYLKTNTLESSSSNIGTKKCQGGGDLPLTNVIKGSKAEAFALLRQWNAADLPDDQERHRNQRVFMHLGNRNPFIDHPEYVDRIWGDASTVMEPSISMATTLDLVIGDSRNLNARIQYGTGTVSYVTADAGIATVDASGNVKGIAAGTTKITASAAVSGKNITASCTVTVRKPVSLTSLTVVPKTLTINEGATAGLTVTVQPAGAASAVTWSSDKTDIATVDAFGVVTGVSPGEATITATAKQNTGIKDTCAVTVMKAPEVTGYQKITSADGLVSGARYVIGYVKNATEAILLDPAVTGGCEDADDTESFADSIVHPVDLTHEFILSGNASAYHLRSTISGKYLKLPASKGDFSMTAASNDLYLAAAADKTTIKASASSQYYLQYNKDSPRFRTYNTTQQPIFLFKAVAAGTVTSDLVSLMISQETATIDVGGSIDLDVTAVPAEAMNAVTWSSDKTDIATVDAAGVVHGIAAGTATVTATAKTNNAIKAACSVTVRQAAPLVTGSEFVSALTEFPGRDDGKQGYVETEKTQTIDGIEYAACNYMADTGQIRGNGSGQKAGKNFYICNLTPMPQDIRSVRMTEQSDGNFKDKCTLVVGSTSQKDVTSGGLTSLANTSSDDSYFEWSVTGAAKYFKIYSKNAFTSNEVRKVSITITLAADPAVTLQNWIDEYLYLEDYTDNKGWCADTEHQYYAKAKEALLKLDEDVIELLQTDDRFQAAKERYLQWASANHDDCPFEDNEMKQSLYSSSESMLYVIMSVVVLSLTAVTAAIILIRRKYVRDKA